MKMNKKVSIIIPVYNEEDFIYEALLRLVEQDVPPASFEIIVVDNNCQDKTIEKVKIFQKEHPQLSIKIVEEKKQGIEYARKRGFDLGCRCPYLATIDADTLVKKSFVSEIIASLQSKKADAIVWKLILPWEVMLEFSPLVRKRLGEFIKKKEKAQQFIQRYFGPTILGPCYAVTSRIYKKTGALSFGSSPLRYADDIIFSKRILYQGGKIINSPNSVIISERRLRFNPESYLTGESHWGVNKLKFVRGGGKMVNLEKLDFRKLWAKRLKISAHIFLSYFLDALLFLRSHPQAIIPKRIVTGVVELQGLKDIFSLKKNFSKGNWSEILKKLEEKYSDEIIFNISKYVKKVDKS